MPPSSAFQRSWPLAWIVQTPLLSTDTDCFWSIVSGTIPIGTAVQPAGRFVAVTATFGSVDGRAACAGRLDHPASARTPAIMAREMYLPRCIVSLSLSLLFIASGRECGACSGPGIGAGALPQALLLRRISTISAHI